MARGDNPVFQQSTFAGGEVSPEMYGRVDYKKHRASLRSCVNWLVTPRGALVNRSGSKYVGTTKSGNARLVPFIFSSDQALVLEFGDSYIRFYQNGAQVVDGGGTPIEVATSYAAADLWRLKFAQSGDVVTICHPNYEPMDLKRLNTAGTLWSLTVVFPDPVMRAYTLMPLTVFFNNWAAGWATGTYARTWSYAVTAVYANGIESYPIWTTDQLIDRQTNHPQIQWTQDPSDTPPVAFNIYLGRSGVWGLLDTVDPANPANVFAGWVWQYTDDGNLAPDFASPPPEHVQPFPMATLPYTVNAFYYVGDRVLLPDGSGGYNTWEAIEPGVAANHLVPPSSGVFWDGWDAARPSGIAVAQDEYACFSGAVWQVISAGGNTAADSATTEHYNATRRTGASSQIVDGTAVWQWIHGGGFVKWKFIQVGTADPVYPAVVSYIDQRKVYARGLTSQNLIDPAKIVGSKIGSFNDFDVAPTPLDTDAIDFSLASTRYEEIRSFLQLRVLLALTSEKDWAISGSNGVGPITPSSILARPNNVRGAAWLDPLVVGVNGLYVQALGTQIWELVFDFYTQSYLGNDVTVEATHLFLGHQIVDWAYAAVPYSVVYAVREDGVLLGFTYIREQEIMAWHQHTTSGLYKSVCAIPETISGISETGVYVVVQRVINGVTKYFVERFSTRATADDKSGVFLDASIYTHALAGGVLDKTAVGASLMDHLEGASVMAVIDGEVAGPYTVAGGVIDISADFPDDVYSAVVGLPYTCDAESLDLYVEGQDIRAAMKDMYRAHVDVVSTRGLSVGPDFDHLQEMPQRLVSDSYGSPALYTGLVQVRVPSHYETDGRVVIRQAYPLPATVVGLHREVNLGGH